jgi:hypothetical protein
MISSLLHLWALAPFAASATWFTGFTRRVDLRLQDILDAQVFVSEASASGISVQVSASGVISNCRGWGSRCSRSSRGRRLP